MHASLEQWGDWMRASGAARDTIRTRTGNIRAFQGYAGLSDPRAATTVQLLHWLAGDV